MNLNSRFLFWVPVLFISIAACSTPKKAVEHGSEVARIMDARAQPSTVQLDQSLKTAAPVEVFADVVDQRAPVKKVTLKLDDSPVVVNLQKVGYSSWYAKIPQETLKKLAVPGQVKQYSGTMIAENTEGDRFETDPGKFQFSVTAPSASG